MLKRSLILRVLKVYGDRIEFSIIKQSNRGFELNPTRTRAKDKYKKTLKGKEHFILSCYGPQLVITETETVHLYVRGSQYERDNKSIRCSRELFTSVIVPLVLAYNQKYNRNLLEKKDVIWHSED